MIDEHKAKIILWGITIITGILVLRCLFSPNKAWIFPLLILLILSCPKIDERINKITKATTTFYFEKISNVMYVCLTNSSSFYSNLCGYDIFF